MKPGPMILADMIDYKTSNTKGYRYIFIKIDFLSEYLWTLPTENKKYSEAITDEFSKILTTSKRSPLKKNAIEVLNFITINFKIFQRMKIFNTIQDAQTKDHQ